MGRKGRGGRGRDGGERTEQGVLREQGKGLFEGLVHTGGALLSKYPRNLNHRLCRVDKPTTNMAPHHQKTFGLIMKKLTLKKSLILTIFKLIHHQSVQIQAGRSELILR